VAIHVSQSMRAAQTPYARRSHANLIAAPQADAIVLVGGTRGQLNSMKITAYLVAALALAACVGAAQGQVTIYAPATPSEKITFDSKEFSDSGDTGVNPYLYVAGTLTGVGIPYPNNSVSVTCYRDRGKCFVVRVEQIGGNLIGRITAPEEYPIARWTKREVVATDDDNSGSPCRITIISIERKTQAATWIDQTNPHANPVDCRNADTGRFKWTIEDWRP
jgi:hypothetical protein